MQSELLSTVKESLLVPWIVTSALKKASGITFSDVEVILLSPISRIVNSPRCCSPSITITEALGSVSLIVAFSNVNVLDPESNRIVPAPHGTSWPLVSSCPFIRTVMLSAANAVFGSSTDIAHKHKSIAANRFFIPFSSSV